MSKSTSNFKKKIGGSKILKGVQNIRSSRSNTERESVNNGGKESPKTKNKGNGAEGRDPPNHIPKSPHTNAETFVSIVQEFTPQQNTQVAFTDATDENAGKKVEQTEQKGQKTNAVAPVKAPEEEFIPMKPQSRFDQFMACLFCTKTKVVPQLMEPLNNPFHDDVATSDQSTGPISVAGMAQMQKPVDINIAQDFNQNYNTGSMVLYGKSFNIWSLQSPFRQKLFELVQHDRFENLVISCIVLSSILLAMDNPNVTHSPEWAGFFFYADLVLTIIFTFEMVCKMITFGLLCHQGAYLQSVWNWLDMTVVITALLSIVVAFYDEGGAGGTLKAIKALRLLRMLRALSMMQRFPGVKMVINSLFSAVPAIMSVMLLWLLTWIVFAILGMNLLMGKMGGCSDPSIQLEKDCVGLSGEVVTVSHAHGAEADVTQLPPENFDQNDRIWLRPITNYDHIGYAMLTLFEVVTMEGWPTIMFSSIHAIESPAVAMYYVIWILFSSFLFMNAVSGVIYENFQRLSAYKDGSIILSQDEMAWVDTLRFITDATPREVPRPPPGRIRSKVWKVVTNPWFELFIIAAIMVNTLMMCLTTWDQTQAWVNAMKVLNYVFTILFFIEAFTKVFALRSKVYFEDRFNRFDFFLANTSMIELLVDVSLGDAESGGINFDPSYLRILRVFKILFKLMRVMRISRLMKTMKFVHILQNTIVEAFPEFACVVVLMAVIFFMYAILGMTMFGNIKYQDTISVHCNFETFGSAFLTLFRVSTGEDWNAIMHDTMVLPPFCETVVRGDPEKNNCGLGYGLEPLYFMSFIFIVTIVMMNLTISVVLDKFQSIMRQQDIQVSTQTVNQFIETWSQYDPTASWILPVAKVKPLLRRLKPPLGPGKLASRREMSRFLNEIDLPVHYSPSQGGEIVHFTETLYTLSKRVVGCDLPDSIIVSRMQKKLASMVTSAMASDSLAYRISQICVVRHIQAEWRAKVRRRKLAEANGEVISAEPETPVKVSKSRGKSLIGARKSRVSRSRKSHAWGAKQSKTKSVMALTLKPMGTENGVAKFGKTRETANNDEDDSPAGSPKASKVGGTAINSDDGHRTHVNYEPNHPNDTS